jgi:4a-hydroxytetrahydrobiopterin dehydratase
MEARMLADSNCAPVDKSSHPITVEEARKLMEEVPGWEMKDSAITREFKYKNFSEAMRFVNRVADLAEGQDHHPDIHISYNKVRLDLSTHKIGGLSMNDFIMAAKVNRL